MKRPTAQPASENTGYTKAALAIVGLFALLSTIYSIVTPLFESPDELFHYPMVQYLATHKQLPVLPPVPGVEIGPWEQEGNQPPLYYILSAALTSGIDTSDMETVRHLNPYAARGVAMPDGSNPNVVIHDPAVERFPWKGTVLAMHLIRLFSVVCGAWAVYLTWRLIGELFPRTPWLALAAAAIHAFTPMVLFISSSVNNDALVIPLCTLALLFMVRLVKSQETSAKAFIPLGVATGLAILTKESALALLPFAAATALWTAWLQDRTLSLRLLGRFLVRLLVWLLPVTLIAGWWYARNFRLYGDWLGLNAFVAIVSPRGYPLTLAQLWDERTSFLTSYWGNFGWLNVLMPTWCYGVLNMVAIIAGLGLIGGIARWLRRPFRLDGLTVARLLATGWPLAIFVSLIRWTSMTPASQGRLVFPAIASCSAGLALGLSQWIPQSNPRLRQGITGGLGLFMLGLSLVAPVAWIAPAYRPPAALTPEEQAAIPHPMKVTFGSSIELIGYKSMPAAVHTGEAVELTLYWRALAPTANDHALFIHLLGEGERIVAQRDSFLGRGLVPTTHMKPGKVWAERYLLDIPATAFTPDTLTPSVGFYNITTGARMPVNSGPGTSRSDSFHLDTLALTPLDGPIPNTLNARFGKGMRLQGYDLSAVSIRQGSPLTLTLYWACTQPLEQDHTISVQLINGAWQKAAQSDSWPLNGEAPTTSWTVRQELEEARVLQIAPNAVPGTYTLQLAVYAVDEEKEIHHLPVTWQAHQYPESTLTLTQIRVR